MPPPVATSASELDVPPLIPPLRDNEVGVAPEASRDHVCEAPITNGAEIVTRPEFCASVMPTDEDDGAMVRLLVPKVPLPIVTDVTPAGALVNWRSLIVKLPSSVVAIAGPVALTALKMTVLAAPGVKPALSVPAAFVVQFVVPALNDDQLPPSAPRQ